MEALVEQRAHVEALRFVAAQRWLFLFLLLDSNYCRFNPLSILDRMLFLDPGARLAAGIGNIAALGLDECHARAINPAFFLLLQLS